jgi:hypothetical protein
MHRDGSLAEADAGNALCGPLLFGKAGLCCGLVWGGGAAAQIKACFAQTVAAGDMCAGGGGGGALLQAVDGRTTVGCKG